MSGGNQPDVLLNVYETTLNALKEQHNDRLWFNTTLQLGKLYFEKRDFEKLSKVRAPLQVVMLGHLRLTELVCRLSRC